MDPEATRAFLVNLYSLYRTECMNCIYFGRMLSRIRKLNLGLEILLAIGTSTVLAAWTIFQVGTGELLWKVIAGLAALLAIVKPIIDLGSRMVRCEKLHSGHNGLYLDLKSIVEDVAVARAVTPANEAAFKASRERAKELSLDDDPRPNAFLVREAYKEVNRRIPAAALWMPK